MTINVSNSLLDQPQLGVGLTSPLVTNNGTGDFQGISGADNVKQCIEDLLLTRVGERLMNEDFGTPFPPLIFSNASGLVDVLPALATEAINRFEPRVNRVKATATMTDSTTIELNISWVVKATGFKGNLVYPFYLQQQSA